MKPKKYQLGWMIALIAVITLACTCGGLSGLGQANQQQQTAEALATSVIIDGSGNVTVGSVPENIPVMDGAQNLVSAGGAVSYSVAADLKTVQEFFQTEMVNKGWTESQAPVVVEGVAATLMYENDTDTANIGLAALGGETQVGITITSK